MIYTMQKRLMNAKIYSRSISKVIRHHIKGYIEEPFVKLDENRFDIARRINKLNNMKNIFPSLIEFDNITGTYSNDYVNIITILEKIDRSLIKINGDQADKEISIFQHHPGHIDISIPYHNNLMPYLEPIINSTVELDYNMAKKINEIWIDMVNKKEVMKIIQKIAGHISYSNDIEMIVSRYVSSESDVGIISRFIEKLCTYDIIDDSMTNDILLESRDSMIKALNNVNQFLTSSCNQLEHDIEMQQMISLKGFDEVVNTIKENEFEKLVVEKYTQKILIDMVRSFKEMKITKFDLETNEGMCISKIDKNFKLTENENYNMNLTKIVVFLTIKDLYLQGWNKWTQLTLLDRGIGINNIGFDRCFEIGSDYGSSWILKNSQSWPSNKYKIDDVLNMNKTKRLLKLQSTLEKMQ